MIAQTPLSDRAASRMLHLDRRSGAVRHRTFCEIVEVLEPGDLLVLNNTRVTALRLLGRKTTGGQVELLILSEIEPGVYEALVRPGRRLKPGAKVEFDGGLSAAIEEETEAPKRRVRFHAPQAIPSGDGEKTVRGLLNSLGQTPLPPYIHARLADPERYQTVYSAQGGSAAAPTAGLHFTPELLSELAAKGVEIAWVTLDVSLDTFRPVEADDLDDHVMHGERAMLPPETKEAIARCRGRIVAVGTTAVRTLESFAAGPRRVDSGVMKTRLFIRPGYSWQVVDGLLTNFHLPRTTMMVLVSALAGREPVLAAYAEAMAGGYRFLSFGDAMLIL